MKLSDEFKKEMERIFQVAGLGLDKLTEDTQMNLVDSLGRAEIVLAAEIELGKQLTDAQILSLKTYGDLVKILEEEV